MEMIGTEFTEGRVTSGWVNKSNQTWQGKSSELDENHPR